MLFLVIGMAPALALAQASLLIAPNSTSVQTNDLFTLTVDLDNPTNEEVDALEIHLTFDPSKLEVVSISDNPSFALPLIATTFDNNAGTITSVKGDFPPYLSAATITALTIEFRALDTTTGTPIVFQGVFPNQSQATSGGTDIVGGSYIDGLIVIEEPCPANVGSETINATICDNESYDFFGQSVSSAGTQVTMLTDQNGCDSVEVTLNLSVNPTFNETETLTICESELPVQFGSQTLNAAGQYTETFQSQDGCDSIVALTLNVNPTIDVAETLTVCDSELPIQFGNQTLNAAGQYSETFQSQDGCDSTVNVTLNVTPTFDETEIRTVCDSELPIQFGSQTLTGAGTFVETFQSQDGCDSTVTLTLNVNPTFDVTDDAFICEGQSLSFGSLTLTASGQYTQTFQSQSGCDSTVTLNLTVGDEVFTELSETICAGESFFFAGLARTTTGTYIDNLPSATGCDSIVVLSLTVTPTFNETESRTVCASELPIQFGGQTLSVSGQYTQTFQSQDGCDSTVTLTLNVNPTFDLTETLTVCESELPVQFGSQTLSAAGQYTETFQSQNGCDSTVTLTLNVNPTYDLTINETIEPGQSFSFGGVSYDSDTTVTETFQTAAGCDSVVTLVLEVMLRVELFITPDTAVAGIGQQFSVDIFVNSGSQPLNGFQLDMTFDPSVVQVDSITEEAVAEFPVPLISPVFFDNVAGTIDYARGVFPPTYPSGLIKLATVYLTAQSLSTGSPLAFVTDTDVTFGGVSVLTDSEDGTLVVVNSADLTLTYDLEGRSDETGADGNGLTVELYEPGTTTLLQSFTNLAGSATGELTLSALTIDEYDVWFKHSKYLARLKNVNLLPGNNQLDMGTLPGGDVNDDNSILVGDFSILSSNFNVLSFDSRADIDNSGTVGILDFSLLSANFNTSGAMAGGAYSLRTSALYDAWSPVGLAWTFASEQVEVGQLIKGYLLVQAGEQPIDGVEAHLSFDPHKLEVERLVVGGKLPIALQNAYDNEQGTLDIAAGSLGSTLSGEFQVAEVTFRSKEAGRADVAFVARNGWQQHATSLGREVLGQTNGQTLTIGSDATTDLVASKAETLELRVFPVPSQGQVTVEIDALRPQGALVLTVYDQTGRVVITQVLSHAGKTQLDLSQQATGVYRVQVRHGEQQVSRNIIIEK